MLYVKLILFMNLSFSIIADFLCTNKNREIKIEKELPTKKTLKRTTSSVQHLYQYDQYDKNFDKPQIINVNLSLQTREYCERCQIKLYHNRQRYFAFDNEYCVNCWNRLSTRVSNTHS